MIFNKRLIFVAGKGGVGKTTISAALAMAAARLGKQALLVETADGESLGAIFTQERLTMEPIVLQPGIQGARIDPKQVLKEYVKKHISIGFVANRIVRAELFDHLAEATPGLAEIMTLGQIWRWEKRRNAQDEYVFDMIIVDTPATGHGLSLLRQPQTLVNMLKFGPIARQTRQVQELLEDTDKTGVLLVALAEELPVNEAIEFIQTIEQDMNMTVCQTIVNALYEDLFTADDIERLRHWRQNEFSNPALGENPLIAAALTYISRRRIQQAHLERLAQASPRDLLEIPYYFTNALSVVEIKVMAELMLAARERCVF